MPTIGMVVEGPHDLLLLGPLIEAEFLKSGKGPVTFRQLQPIQDETGEFEGGGWTRVVAWCQANSGDGLDTFFQPLFEDQAACDAIIVHLDGDALELAGPKSSIVIPIPPISTEQRVKLVCDAIEEWLATPEAWKARIAPAVPVMQTEAWIVSSERDLPNIEKINAKEEFRRTHSWRTHGKMAGFYDARARVAKQSVDAIAARCLSYSQFVAGLGKLEI